MSLYYTQKLWLQFHSPGEVPRIPVLYFSISLKRMKSWGWKLNNARSKCFDCENLRENHVWCFFVYLICPNRFSSFFMGHVWAKSFRVKGPPSGLREHMNSPFSVVKMWNGFFPCVNPWNKIHVWTWNWKFEFVNSDLCVNVKCDESTRIYNLGISFA